MGYITITIAITVLYFERSSIFTKAADLLATKYRLRSLAATMAGQVI